MPGDLDLIEVIHSGAAERTVAGGKACWVDNVGLDAEAGGETKNRARVLGDVGLIKRNAYGEDCSHARNRHRGRKSMARERFMRRVVLAIQVRIAHLRSLGKGANKTPLDLAAWPLARREESGRFARRRQAAVCVSGRERARLLRGESSRRKGAAGGLTDKKGLRT